MLGSNVQPLGPVQAFSWTNSLLWQTWMALWSTEQAWLFSASQGSFASATESSQLNSMRCCAGCSSNVHDLGPRHESMALKTLPSQRKIADLSFAQAIWPSL